MTAIAQWVVGCDIGDLETTTIDKFGLGSSSGSWVVSHVGWVALSSVRSRSRNVCPILTAYALHDPEGRIGGEGGGKKESLVDRSSHVHGFISCTRIAVSSGNGG